MSENRRYDLYRHVDPLQQLRQAENACEVAYYGLTDRMAHKLHHYLEVYERHLSAFRRRPVRMLEIGVQNGGSLQMWRRYLGPEAILHGLDIDERCRQIDDPDLRIHIGSQVDTALLDAIVDEMGGSIDVVLDDGSHQCSHQIATFEHLWPRLADRGVYLCEDVQTSYWDDYGGGLRDPRSFIEYAKRKVDLLHAPYLRGGSESERDTAFARQAVSVLFYDGLVVFEKRERDIPYATVMGSRCIIPQLLEQMAKSQRS
jgi:cephalosporin hydroxylase